VKDFFKDEQREVVGTILKGVIKDIESRFKSIYQDIYPLVSYLSSLRYNLPAVLEHIAEFVHNQSIQEELKEHPLPADAIRKYIHEAESWDVLLDETEINRILQEVAEERIEI